MEFNISNENNDLLMHLDTLDINEKNIFINHLIKLGYQEYQKNQKKDTAITKELEILNIKYDKQYENIKLLINEIKLENEKNNLILNKNNNKGSIGENIIFEFFNKNKYNIEDTSNIAHSGDLKLYLEEINENILIEIKNYKYTVDQKQIDKFYYDLNYTGIKLGIFISLQSKIVNIKYPIEWKITNNKNIIIFLSNCTEEYLYMAIFSIITLYKHNNQKKIINLNNQEDLINDIKFLSLQKESINKLKNEILNIHDLYSNNILSLYNNLCNFDNNFNYIINKIYNKISNNLSNSNINTNEIILKINNLSNNNKNLLEIIISDLFDIFKLELNDDNKKIIITDKNNNLIGEFKILKTTINLLLQNGLEIKNVNIKHWKQIKELL